MGWVLGGCGHIFVEIGLLCHFRMKHLNKMVDAKLIANSKMKIYGGGSENFCRALGKK
jgi:hypothetical protein